MKEFPTKYYVSKDGKHFYLKHECEEHECQIDMGIRKLERNYYLNLLLDAKDEIDSKYDAYTFIYNPEYSLEDYYKACQLDIDLRHTHNTIYVMHQASINGFQGYENIKKIKLIENHKYILVKYTYDLRNPLWDYKDSTYGMIGDLDKAIEFINQDINKNIMPL